MSEESDRFRARAMQCRDLAPLSTHWEIRDMLVQVAGELDEEADRIDAEEAGQPPEPPSAS